MDKKEIAPLFDGWDKTMIWSYLQGYMGYAMTDENNPPKSAQIIEGDFCFFAGKPNAELVTKAAAPILVPRTEKWSQ